jgi:iron complex outermembrane receptor protein
VDYFLPTFPVPAGVPNVAGGPNFTSEKVVAWEAGYRFQPSVSTSFSLAAFYNQYDDLYSVEALPNTVTYQIQNGTEGNSRGVEFSGRVRPGNKWRLRGGYSYFYKELSNKPGRTYDYSALGNDAENRVTFQSMLDLPANFQLDVTFRYIDPLPKPAVPDYMTFDARIAWVHGPWEIAVIGQNLMDEKHQEYLTLIPRTIYGNIACRF